MEGILVKDIDCSFRVFRKRATKNVITISLWKGNIGYVFNLSNTILWWGRNMETLYPGWNVRFYIDGSIFRSMKEDIDWHMVIDQLKKRRNVEVWLYFCEWGHHDQESSCKRCHTGTFGSLLRFHAFEDPTVNIAVSRNVEMLSSPKLARIVHHWANLPVKQYHIIYNIEDGYSCGYGNPTMCADLQMTNTNVVVAWFGFKKTRNLPNPYPNLFSQIRRLINVHYQTLGKFPYGIDEIVLTRFFKPLMNHSNTYTTPRQLLNQIIPANSPNWNKVLEYIMDFLKMLPKILPKHKKQFFDKVTGGLWYWDDYINYAPFKNSRIIVQVGELAQIMPDVIISLLRYVKKRIQPRPQEKRIMQYMETKMMRFYFTLFKNNVLQRGIDNTVPQYNFFARAGTPRKAELMFYMATKTVVFETIDFPGLLLKTKSFEGKRPDFGSVDEKTVENILANKKRRWKTDIRTKRRPMPSDDVIRERIRQELQRNISRKEQDYDKNRQIFLRNIKHAYLFSDRDYT